MLEMDLSYAQREILEVEIFSQNTGCNNIGGLAILYDIYSYDEMNSAINNLVEKNEIFRTRIKHTKGTSKYSQYITDFAYDDFPVYDFLNKKDLYDEWIDNEMNSAIFDFDEKLYRGYIIKLPDGKWGMLVIFHHLIGDAWSGINLYNYICYSLLSIDIDFDSLKSYAKIIENEHLYRNSKRYLNDSKYWSRKMKEYSGNPAYVIQSSKEMGCTRYNFEIDSDTTRDIYRFCNDNDCSIIHLFTAFLGIYKANLTSSDSVSIGYLSHNRNTREEYLMLGVFSRVLPLIFGVDENLTFKEFVTNVKIESYNLLRHRKYSYLELIENNSESHGLVDIMVSYQNAIFDKELAKSATGKWLYPSTSGNPLCLHISNRDNSDTLQFDYDYHHQFLNEENTILFHNTILRMFEQVCNNGNLKIKDLKIISEDEEDMILNKFNYTMDYFDRNYSVVDLIEKQVKLHSNKVAIKCDVDKITYEQLNNSSNYLSSKLVEQGIKKDDIVCIITSRDIKSIIAMLAVLKAGASYVCIDCNYPKSRIDYILKDSATDYVLNYKNDVVYDTTLAKTIIVEKYYDHVENLNKKITLDSLAYVIYTSGSTGNPKGVMIEHRSLLNLIENYTDIYDMSENDTVLQFSSMTFDQSVWDIYNILCVGGTLCLTPEEVFGNPTLIEKYINEQDITFAGLTPAFIKELNPDKIDSLRVLESGSATFYLENTDKWLDKSRVFNTYGPTETTVNALTYEMSNLDNSTIPIGKPIKNTQVYILSKNQLCGINMVGELCIAGAGVARGYLNNPKLTPQKFVDNPFGTKKMYRTGDLVKWLPNGEIEYVGRVDDQVKIRGIRIELGEIENALLELEEIIDAVVIVQEDSHQKSISAYLMTNEEIDNNEIKVKLRKKLPEYMIPQGFMKLEKFPLNSSGKIDKKSLPKIEIVHQVYIEPKTKMEKAIAEIYQEVLQVEQIGLRDSFFDLGGHSLKVTRVVNEIESQTGIRIKLKEIFLNPIVEDLAKMVESIEQKEYFKIPKVEQKGYYAMSSPQKRLYMLNEISNTKIVYNMPAVLEFEEEVDKIKIKDLFIQLIQRHEILRTSFHNIDNELVQKIHDKVELDFSEEKVIGKNKKEIFKEFVRPFRLNQPSLLRVKVIETETKNYLLLDIHHIISDGMSINIIIQEFSQLYQGNELNELELHYKDYSEWLSNRDLNKQKEYWLQEFIDEIPVLDMPLDYQRPLVRSFEGANVTTKVNNELYKKVKEISSKTGTTEYMVLLASLMVLLSKYSNQEDIIVGSPVSGRTHSDTETMLGMFVNTLAMRGKPERCKTFEQFLLEIKETSLKAFENQEYPFEELVENLDIKRDLSRNPLFDVMFIMQNNDKNEIPIDGIKGIDLEDSIGSVSKLDLSIVVMYDETGYLLNLEYCKALFSKQSIEDFSKRYLSVLEQLVSEIEISKINILLEKEKDLILNSFNKPILDVKQPTLIELINTKVDQNANKIAIRTDNESLTYQELDILSNKVANKLLIKGVTRGDIIPIMANYSINILVAMLAVIKIGGMYLLLDNDVPDERLKYMLEESSEYILVSLDCKERVSQVEKNNVFVLEEIINDEKIKSNRVSIDVDENEGCYMIYTSGTTGKPKASITTRKNIANFCINNDEFLNLIEKDSQTKIISNANVSFDMFVSESIFPLLTGIEIVLCSKEQQTSQKEVARLIEENECTMLQITPSKLRMFMEDESNLAYLQKIKIIILGGEAFDSNLYKKVKKQNQNIRIFNLYGPSETTVWVTTKEIKDVNQITIGKPIKNTQIYILSNNQLCGINMIGELCIAGDGVVRGYLNNPKLTAQNFVDNPFGTKKMYRTGDLARWLSNGEIEYIGRVDGQIKIRGLRIELIEIEKVLLELDEIKDATVVVQEENQDKTICAYVVSDEKIDNNKIKERLRKIIPEYMVPQGLMQLDKLPLNSSGKINKKALPKIEVVYQIYIELNTEIEKAIAKIYEEVLHVEQVGLRDSFFDLGGHSLKATKVVNEIESLTGIRIKLKEIFLNPIVEDLAKVVESIEQKEYVRIPKVAQKEHYPMSSSQKRLYLINEIDDTKIVYNMPAVLELEGNIEKMKVKDVFNKLIQRHEILRTSFHNIDNELVQKVHDKVELDFSEEKVIGKNKKEMFKEFVRPFRLDQPSLLRVKLIKTETKNYLLFDIHHIISDGMSINIIIQEFSQLYQGNELNELELHYKDYSEWLNNQDLSKQKEYWLQEFIDEIPVLDMPLDYQRPLVRSFEGANVTTKVNNELYKKVKEISSKTGTTEYMVLLASLMVLLSKYSNQEDIIVGSPVSGRTHSDTETMLGMFVNTLAMRGKPERCKTFEQFLLEIKETSLKAFENQEYPFEELVENLDIKRDLSRNPLFDVMFIMQNNDKNEIPIDGIKGIDLEDSIGSVSKLDLSIVVMYDETGYLLNLEYCKALFSKQSIEDFSKRYLSVLEQLVSEIEISKINILLEKEKDLILNSFNKPILDVKQPTLIELINTKVDQNANKIAIRTDNESLTYQELDILSNKVANKLLIKGVTRGDIIPIMANYSINILVAMLAVIKIGGMYLLLDNDVPDERLKYMLEESSEYILASLDCKERVSQVEKNNVFVLEEIINDEKIKSNRVSIDVDENEGCYMIYTSGTTGKPKASITTRKNIANFCINNDEFLNLIEKDSQTKIISNANVSFDMFVSESIFPLLTGIEIVLCSKEQQTSQKEVARLIEENECTMLQITPSKLRMFMEDESNLAYLQKIKIIILGGEAFDSNLYKKVKKQNQNIRIFNLYGPSETTVWVTTKEIKDVNQITIGKPIKNTQIYILSNNQLCGINMIGELCIAGDGVVRGYLNNPKLTAQNFVDNPFGTKKMYRTGDLARWLSNGEIEYIGRVDGQIKIRGLRIELIEIEKVLLELDEIKDATVVVQEENQDKTICAYIVSDEKIDSNKIKERLRKILPEYMVPQGLMQLDKLPLNSSGKINKKVLPKIEIVHQEYVLPITQMEKAITEIYQKVLQVEQVGLKDSFFDLGGHSLKATKVVNEIESLTGIRIKLKEIFLNPIVEDLAKMVESIEQKEYIRILKAEQKEYYAMSSSQKRLYLLYQLDDTKIAYNMPFILEIEGNIEKTKIKDAFNKLIQHHEILRTSFHNIDNELVQKVHDKVELAFSEEKTTDKDKQKTFKAFVRPFKLDLPSLLRVKVIETEMKNYLLVDIHHIVSDGVSVNIIIQEFSQLYQGIELNESKLHYKDYSEWLNNQDLSKQKEYWLQEFVDEIPVLDMSLDYQRPLVQSFEGANVTTKVNSELYKKVKEISSKTETTEYMVLLASLMILLSKYSNQEDIIVGSPVSGRIHRDTERMLGMFVNTLAMRARPERYKTFEKFLLEIKETSLKAFENQEYPFEELVENLDIKRDISRNPLFDVLFTMQNNDMSEISVDGINEVNFEDSVANVSKLDLSVSIMYDEAGYLLNLEYCKALFNRPSIEDFSKRYLLVLEQLVCDIEIDKINILLAKEKDLILNSFNAPSIDNKQQTLIDLINIKMDQYAKKIAICNDNESLTYQELDILSNKVANKLLIEGVTRGDIIPIMANYSINILVAMIGVIKAGGMYLLLDNDTPVERLKYMLEESSECILVSFDSITLVEQVEKSKILVLDEIIDDEKTLIDRPIVDVDENDGCYVIYTSGTTGKPKASITTHHNIVNFCINNDEIFNRIKNNSNARILSLTNVSFDLFVTESIFSLLNGIEIVLCSKQQQISQKEVARLVVENKCTVLQTTPSKLKMLMENENNLSYLQKLEVIILGGEVFDSNLYREIKKNNSNTTIYNIYGPSETTVWTSIKEVNDEMQITIGKPLKNTQVYILSNNQLCGINMTGELCIAGAGVAYGYLNNEELTAQSFVDNPYGTKKMYLTKDLARWLPNGEIEYVGRADDQVKIRGLRIELIEIEKVLLEIDEIKDATVVVQEENQDKNICAYIVSDEKIDNNKIKERLRKKLPEYMVPQALRQLDILPLNSSGKVDKNALPKIEIIHQTYIAPSTEIEKAIATIYQEILQVEQIGVKDSFFDLGGHSLKAITVVTKLSEYYNVSLQDIFQYPTIEKLSKVITLKKKQTFKDKFDKMVKKDRIYKLNKTSIENKNKYIIDSGKYNILDYKVNESVQNVLLTGVTGYLGIHILNELLLETNHNIHLIVRSKNDLEAKDRVEKNYQYYFQQKISTEYENRIFYYSGDISQKNFGISNVRYFELSNEIDLVINSAANVSHYELWENSYQSNVVGVQKIISFAGVGKKKIIHHMSTISIASGNIEGSDNIIYTENDFDLSQKLDSVYLQTKFEAEKLLIESRQKGISTNIYRIGNLQCQYSSGIFQLNANDNAFINIIKTLVLLKKYPSTSSYLEFTPVDLAAKACVKIIENDVLSNEIYHIFNDKLLNFKKIITVLQDHYSLEEVDEIMFVKYILDNKILDSKMQDRVNMLLTHLGVFSHQNKVTNFEVLNVKTNNILKQMDFEWKEVTENVLSKMIVNLVNDDFFKLEKEQQ